MKKLFSKTAGIFLLLTLNASGMLTIGSTLASFNDIEESSSNSFTAGPLDFSLTADEWSPEAHAGALAPGDLITRHMNVLQGDSISFQYKIKTVKTSGDDAFCNALHLFAKRGVTTLYDGALMSFNLMPSVEIEVDGQDDWTFDVDLPSSASAFNNKACEFRFDVDGWQIGFADASSGFSDHEELENILESAVQASEEGTDSISSIADSYVDQDHPTTNNGTDSDLRVKSRSGSKNKRTFARFDFHLPTDTTINSAALKLFLENAPSASRTYAVSRALSSWNETGIIWNNQPATSSPATAAATTGTTNDRWLSWNVKNDVSGFVAGTFSNYGWEVFDTAESSGTTREGKFHSRENDEENTRPVLEVAFSAPPATTTHIVVNEVYADVGSGKGFEGTNEWVELYNPTPSSVDIKNWQICDAGACDTLATTSSSILIPSHGFAVITPNASTWTNWILPGAAVKIVIGSNIGGGLANAGDGVIVKNASSVEIDAMSYGTDTSKLNPAVSVSGEGHSLARIIKGYDTNAATDWIINATVNPGTNPSEGGEEIIRFTSEGIEVAAHRNDLPMLAVGSMTQDSQPQSQEEPVADNNEDLSLIDNGIGQVTFTTNLSNEPLIESASTSVPQENQLIDATSTPVISETTTSSSAVVTDQVDNASTTEISLSLPATLPEEQAAVVEKPEDASSPTPTP